MRNGADLPDYPSRTLQTPWKDHGAPFPLYELQRELRMETFRQSSSRKIRPRRPRGWAVCCRGCGRLGHFDPASRLRQGVLRRLREEKCPVCGAQALRRVGRRIWRILRSLPKDQRIKVVP